jgi:hypothetical protein
MPKHYTHIDGFLFTIEYPVFIKGMYKIYWDGFWIGYVYYRLDGSPPPNRIWHATTDYTQLYLSQLSKFIDALDTYKL